MFIVSSLMCTKTSNFSLAKTNTHIKASCLSSKIIHDFHNKENHFTNNLYTTQVVFILLEELRLFNQASTINYIKHFFKTFKTREILYVVFIVIRSGSICKIKHDGFSYCNIYKLHLLILFLHASKI